MQWYFLENEFLKVRVSSKGAELQSIFSKQTNCEYIWQPVQGIWERHSMLLFPNAGRIADNYVVIGGQPYPAKMHGFADEMDFNLIYKDDKKIELEISSNAETIKMFPYKFRMRISFVLENQFLTEKFCVINESKEDIYFSLGAHPGFKCPILPDECGNDYSILFDCAQNIDELCLQKNTRLVTGEKKPFLSGESEIRLSENFFDNGPILAQGMSANSIKLYSNKSGRYIEMSVKGFEYLCLWGVEQKMSIICIEPWCGISDYVGTDHVWERKPGIQRIGVGENFARELVFSVG